VSVVTSVHCDDKEHCTVNTLRIRGAVVALVLGSSAWSCSDSFGPEDVEGRYILESVSSVRLPVTVSGEGWSYQMIADTIWFADARAGSRVQVIEWNDGRGRESYEQQFVYRIRDGRVEVTFACPPNASCVEGPHLLLVREGNKLRATYPPNFLSRDEFLYRESESD
jgi:hypothetical protein